MNETIMCPICDEEFETIEDYDYHYVNTHGKDIVDRKKEESNKQFVGYINQPE